MTSKHHAVLPTTLALAASLGLAALPAFSGQTYNPCDDTLGGQTVTLTGSDLTLEQIVAVARHGAKVQLSPEARQREADNYGLLLEATAEGVAVYWFNRGTGDNRETVLFAGDATSAQNKPTVEKIQLEGFRRDAHLGYGPEVMDEDIVRAMMVVRANEMTYNAPSPQLAQILVDLLNDRITPVVQSRGTVGEGDLAQLGNVAGTMVGAGEAYYRGTRMPAAEALKQAALVVYDARHALEWADLVYAMSLDGMNSSITPLSTVVQRDRPERWLNWDAARVLDMIKGSYLFESDPKRIIQDPESLRASSIRQAAAWEDWALLREAVLFQANSSDHNPAVHVGLGPQDSWELATPQMMRYYVKGGPHSHGQHGYIVSNANWDPYPMANRLESFVIALANMDVAIMLRIERFRSTFFTIVSVSDVLPRWSRHDSGYLPSDLQQEVQSLTNPVAPFGSALETTVEDLQGQTRIKVQRARQAVSLTNDLLAVNLVEASLWLDVRKTQDPHRSFGEAPTAAWTAFRKRLPLDDDASKPAEVSKPMVAADFLLTNLAASFYSGVSPPGVTP
jgi:histidine ammonia-lyase